MKTTKKIQKLFWKTIAIFWDCSPKLHLPKYRDYPIASCEIGDEYKFPKGIKILYQWDEKGKHWIVFTKEPEYFNN